MTQYVYRLRTDGSYIYVGTVTMHYVSLPFQKQYYTKIALFDRDVGRTFDAYKYPKDSK